jgi:hypothetical protein
MACPFVMVAMLAAMEEFFVVHPDILTEVITMVI